MTVGSNAPGDGINSVRSVDSEDSEDSDAVVVVRLPDGRAYEGPIVDLRGIEPTDGDSDSPSLSLSPAALRRAIRGGSPAPADTPTVQGPAPGPVHAHVTVLSPATSVDRRPALAAAAAARGIDTPHDADLEAARRSLRASNAGEVGVSELREARRRAAEAGAETERLRERVATIRGRVTALREADDGPSDGARDGCDDAPDALAAAESSLSEATRRLSEVETDRVAAAQRLTMLEDRARAARDDRDARLRLADRVDNLERDVRAARVAAVEDDFRGARRHLASRATGACAESTSPADDLLDALAVVRIAPISAPVVVAAEVLDALGGPKSAFDRLGAPLVIPARGVGADR